MKSPQNASDIAAIADGVVVGTAIVNQIADGKSPDDVLDFVRSLAEGAHAVAK